ncbi:hypothetical protein LZ30DRAFT_745160 [Colletotrichum cereale]|nr:hypothetical protein LZ30DRAFT_745160 [Colletotrichum cereale]
MLFCKLATLATVVGLTAAAPEKSRSCRNLPGDRDWPKDREWNAFNSSIGGRLIRGAPLAQLCYGPNVDNALCSKLQNTWGLVDPFLDSPISVMSPYWQNNTCNPYASAGVSLDDISACKLGNMPTYAVNVSDASMVVAGVKFARDKNIRLVVKNTGHDFLGGSTGTGALSLWTHYLKDMTFVKKYTSSYYTGAAVKIGAGVQFQDLNAAAARNGLRVVGGSCPTVGATGGWRQGGGHGPLSSAYGLGADQALEYEVVTVKGQQLNVSPKENSDLFWAISGGGGGNYAVVLSATIKAHPDSRVVGSRLTFPNIYGEAFWTAVEAWQKHLLVLDTIPGFSSEALISKDAFSVVVATLPGGDEAAMNKALAPFYQTLTQLNITAVVNETAVQKSYVEHYDEYLGGVTFTRNLTLGGRLIPRSLVRDNKRLPELTATFREMVSSSDTVVYLLGYNVSSKSAGVPPGYNAITPAWRDSLFLVNVGIIDSDRATSAALGISLRRMNAWESRLRDLTPGGGAYGNEGTFNNPEWKVDYFGGTYDRLRSIKSKYDPNFVLYTQTGVGGDEFAQKSDGRLCKV